MIRRLLELLVIVLVAILVGIDFLTRHLAATTVANQARHSTGAASGTASISGFPFLYDTLAEGRVHGVTVHLSEVPAGPGLVLQTVSVDLTGVKLDKHNLWAHRKVTVTAIASGTGVIDVSAPELSAVAHRTVTVAGGGQLLVDVGAGRTVTATASITSGHFLEIRAGGLPVLVVDLARTTLVQECAMSLKVTASGVEASCTMSPVPPSVITALSSG